MRLGFDTTPLSPEQQRWHDEWYVPVLQSKRWATCCADCPLMFEGYGLMPRCCRLPEPRKSVWQRVKARLGR